MNVLVDSSVWVAHFKQRDDRLVRLLETGVVLCHPYVVVEVACGTPPARRAVVRMLSELNRTRVASPEELLVLIDERDLFGRGCGFVDVSLLAGALLEEHTLLWTHDKPLARAALELGRCYRPEFHA